MNWTCCISIVFFKYIEHTFIITQLIALALFILSITISSNEKFFLLCISCILFYLHTLIANKLYQMSFYFCFSMIIFEERNIYLWQLGLLGAGKHVQEKKGIETIAMNCQSVVIPANPLMMHEMPYRRQNFFLSQFSRCLLLNVDFRFFLTQFSNMFPASMHNRIKIPCSLL